MRDVPSASEAIATALIVCDFDPGISTDPDRLDFLAMSLMAGALSSARYILF